VRRVRLREALDGEISEKMLTTTLQELVGRGLVYRRVLARVPPRAEYELTERGRSFGAVLEAITVWEKGTATDGPGS
jgi:DNA-binding HxlR family transcriptional regulator